MPPRKPENENITDPDDPRNALVSERWRPYRDSSGALCRTVYHPAVSLMKGDHWDDYERWIRGDIPWVELCNLADRIDAENAAREPELVDDEDDEDDELVPADHAELEELRALRETVIAFIDERPEYATEPCDITVSSADHYRLQGGAMARDLLAARLGWRTPDSPGDTCRTDPEKENLADV